MKMESWFIFLLTVSLQITQATGQNAGSGVDPTLSLDACNNHGCPNSEYCNVIYTDGAEDASECVSKCLSPRIPNGNRICQDYCTQPQNPCADNPASPYCHRQNTGDKYRCLRECTAYLVPETNGVCTDACSPNPCNNNKSCTPFANGRRTCSKSCEKPKYPDAGKVCVDPCVPNTCPYLYFCKRNEAQRQCVVSDDCPEDHYKNTTSSLCIDGCKPYPCSRPQVCTKSNVSPGYICSTDCSYPYLKKGIRCVDHCFPNPCSSKKFCSRENNAYRCVSAKNCPKNQYANRAKRTCEDVCQEKPCPNNKYCHRRGHRRRCRASCSPGFIPESANSTICQKVTSLESSFTLDQTYTAAYANTSSRECQNSYINVLQVFRRAFNSLNGRRCYNRGCSPGSVKVAIMTEFAEENVTSEVLTKTLIDTLTAYNGTENATQNANGSLVFPALNLTILIDSTTSLDFDECSDEIYYHCPENSTCENTPGSYNCSCDIGFEPFGKFCRDIDNCVNATCHENANCTDGFENYTCACVSGYSGDGYSCVDINECLTDGSCQVNQTCQNYQGGYNCHCPFLQFFVSGSCKDVHSYSSKLVVYQDSVFESRYFGRDQNSHLLDNSSSLFNTFEQTFCSLMERSFNTIQNSDFAGCKVSNYSVKSGTRTRRSVPDGDEITISYIISFIKSHSVDELSKYILLSVLLPGDNGFNYFYDMKITNDPKTFKVICGSGQTDNGKDCVSAPDTKDLDECSTGCAENAQCVLEGKKKLCACISGYIGNGKTYCKMTDMNRLRWILVVVNTVLFASLIVIVLMLIRTKKKVNDRKYKSEVYHGNVVRGFRRDSDSSFLRVRR